MESYKADGGITSTSSDFLKIWVTKLYLFSKLYTHSDTKFHQEFYNECLQRKQSLEDNMALPSCITKRLLNKDITRGKLLMPY